MIPGNTSSQGKYVDPPTSVTASAGNAEATVSFTLPAYDGKGVATYVATSSPSGLTASGASSPLTITGLSNGTSYTFTVTTISGYGVSAVSSASNAVTPVAPPFFPTFTTPPFFPFFPEFTTTPPFFPFFPEFTTTPPFFPFFPFFPEFTTTTTTAAPPPTFTCTALAAANGACAEYQVGAGCVATFFAFNQQC